MRGSTCAAPRAVLAYPFGDYGEGIVWQQALLIPGPRMYGPIDHLPFIVFHYPPVYHLASRAVMAFGVDPLAAGRTVSLAATAVIAISIAWLVAADLAGRVGRSAVLVGAVTGALLPLSFGPVEMWFDRMRVDMLAIALAFLGVVFVARAAERRARTYNPVVAKATLGNGMRPDGSSRPFWEVLRRRSRQEAVAPPRPAAWYTETSDMKTEIDYLKRLGLSAGVLAIILAIYNLLLISSRIFVDGIYTTPCRKIF